MIKQPSYNRIALLVYLFMGSFFAANQLLVSHITLAFQATETQKGYMVSAIYTGAMIVVMIFGEIGERLGKRRAAAIAAFVNGLGAVVIMTAPSVGWVVAGCFIFGAGFSGFESNAISLIGDNSGESANKLIGLANALFSVGAVLSPIALAAVLKEDEYKPWYIFVIAFYAALVCYFLFDKKIDTFAVKGTPQKSLAIFALIRDPVMPLMMLMMMLFIGIETALTYWMSGLFERAGLVGYGAMMLSVYWLASIVGRLGASRLRRPEGIIPYCYAAAAVATALLLILPGALLKGIALALAGIALGPLYGSLIFLSGNRFPENSAAAVSLIIFSGAFGGMIFQPLIGLFVERGAVYGLYGAAIALLAVTAVGAYFIIRKMRGEKQ